MSSEDTEPNYKAFDKIQKFLRDLKETFGSEFPGVAKYYSVCKKINFDNHKAIQFQNKIFGDYTEQNKAAIKAGKLDELNDASFVIDTKIQFNLKQIIAKAQPDAQTRRSITKYLQYICVLFHPDQDIKTSLTAVPAKSKEDEVFDQLFNKMQSKLGDNPDLFGASGEGFNEAQALTNMHSSGIYNDIQQVIGGGIDSGELDPSKLLGNAFGMFEKIKGQVNDPALAGIVGMVENLLNQAKSEMN